ncbi:3-dehydro-bile acid delta(4,6)-reductase [Anaerolineae bacterium]|nr:3-dehydro-bile acid delta(4,6)-reductase [Anaerolineae bacterium]
MTYQIVIIGGGAAGFFAAITCAEANPAARVIILEKTPHVLSKVRISGGGRCNVTNACFDPAELVRQYPRGAAALRGPFTRFQPRDTITWFEQRGVKLKTEADGRVFPISNRSETIVNCLIDAAHAAGVQVRSGVHIRSVAKLDRFVIDLKDADALIADRVLLATGSNPHGYEWAAALGHTIEPPVPSLFTFEIDDARLKDLPGISVEKATVKISGTSLAQTGPVLITHWGLSGPAVLKLSAWAARELAGQHYRAEVLINWLPDFKGDQLQQRLMSIKAELARQSIGASSPLHLPSRLWKRLISAVGIDGDQKWTEVSKRALNDLANELSRGSFLMSGKGAFKEEFVTCGGVRLDEVNFKTMESRRCAGLHFAGEILDIDGVTGGFNFQSAWTTGWLAGRAMNNEQ